jgi:hypothetical protein
VQRSRLEKTKKQGRKYPHGFTAPRAPSSSRKSILIPLSPPESKRGKLLHQIIVPNISTTSRIEQSITTNPSATTLPPPPPLPSPPLPRAAGEEEAATMDSSSGGGGTQIKGMATHGGRYVLYNVYGNLFEVSAKYSPPIRPIGRGAYGIVWCAPSPSPVPSNRTAVSFCLLSTCSASRFVALGTDL